MSNNGLKVGELARRTGVTVRTLHHYDEIGLLNPSLHTDSGHRLYAKSDIARLQQIISLRQLGFSLDEIGNCLHRSDFSPLAVITMHLARLREQLNLQQRLYERLEAIASHLRTAGDVSADEFILTIEGMAMIESYYTPEQLETLKRRREEAAASGDDITARGTADWAALLAEYKAELDKGTPPTDAKMQELEQRRQALVNAFTGGDSAVEQNLKRLWTEQGDKLCAQFGMDPKVIQYLDRVNEAGQG
jgi:MerR family transcriptional regulator, thiopeptide resistance regulator